ncbi:hypothetical protein GCM10009640_17830 [Agrococcus citreus]|uniref:Uncharacterized protein n=1 Tax=Agrococcus citreus TaxID=84643 RepID=A0ABN1YVE6_9MICO
MTDSVPSLSGATSARESTSDLIADPYTAARPCPTTESMFHVKQATVAPIAVETPATPGEQ